MSADFTGWVRIRTYLRMPLGIPMFFRKYDAPPALRMSVNLLQTCIRELLGSRVLRWIRNLLLATWYLVGPLLLFLAARHVWRAPSLDYVLLWQCFSLAVIGLTLGLHALGRLTLRRNARVVFRPLATIPVRLLLLAILWLPVTLKLTFEGGLIFAGTTLAAYLQLAPQLAQWLQLVMLQWGSPRRAGLAHALMSAPWSGSVLTRQGTRSCTDSGRRSQRISTSTSIVSSSAMASAVPYLPRKSSRLSKRPSKHYDFVMIWRPVPRARKCFSETFQSARTWTL